MVYEYRSCLPANQNVAFPMLQVGLLEDNEVTIHHIILTFNDLEREKLVETLLEIELMFVTSIIFLFQQSFLSLTKQIIFFGVTFIMLSANALILGMCKILS